MSANAWGTNGINVFALPMASPTPANPSLAGQVLTWDPVTQLITFAPGGGGGGGGTGKVQAGSTYSNFGVYTEVVFPVPFTAYPSVQVRCNYDVHPLTFMQLANISTTGFFFRSWYRANNDNANVQVPSGYEVQWIAATA